MATESEPPRFTRPPAGEPVALLAREPDLGGAISDEERARAERLLTVPGFRLAVGPLRLADVAQEPQLGALILEGFVMVSVALRDRIGAHLAGPGDVLQLPPDTESMLPIETSYFVSRAAHVAVLDGHFIAAVRRWPELLIALHERLRIQEHRLLVHASIGKLRRVEDRVLAVLWQLAERWGRVRPDGVVVPLVLTHETIGRLAGAERPTVSLALTELVRRGAVQRLADGAFVLDPASCERLAVTAKSARRQALAIPSPTGDPEGDDADMAARRPAVDLDRLRHRLDALREG